MRASYELEPLRIALASDLLFRSHSFQDCWSEIKHLCLGLWVGTFGPGYAASKTGRGEAKHLSLNL